MTELDCCHVDDDISEGAQLRRCSLCTQMAEEDVLILPPQGELTRLGATEEDVEQYPQLEAYDDTMVYSVTEFCRKNLVGVDGTNLQMMEVIDGRDEFILGQVCLFLVKNHIKPVCSDLFMLSALLKEMARRLGEGDIQTVNRRHELRANGVLTADDVVPDAVRSKWLEADGREHAASA